MYWSTSGTLFPFVLTRIIHGAVGVLLALYLLGHSLRMAIVEGTKFDQVSLRGRLAFDIALSIICFAMISGILAELHLLNEFSLSSLLTMLTIGPILVGIRRKRLSAGPAFRMILPSAPVI